MPGPPSPDAQPPGSAPTPGVMEPIVVPPADAPPIVKSEYNLKRIMEAIQKYYDKYQKYPAQVTYAGGQKPLLSWRVHLLPFMGKQDLYQKFKFDEAWDGPTNKPLLAQMPEVYQTPGGPTGGRTCYEVAVGPDTVFGQRGGIALNQIGDGKENTAFVAEVNPKGAVNWSEPSDLRFVPAEPLNGLGGLRGKSFLAVFGDGRVRRIPLSLGPNFVRSVFTANSNDAVDLTQADVPITDDMPEGDKPADSPASEKPAEEKKLEGYLALADKAVQKQDLRRGLAYMMADAAVHGSEDLLGHVRWCAGLKRPVLILRVGVAVQSSAATAVTPTAKTAGAQAGASAQAEVMRMWVEVVGNPMIEKIQTALNDGKFGSWVGKLELQPIQPTQAPEPATPDGRRAPPKPRDPVTIQGGVANLGIAETGRIRQIAFKEGLDVVLMVGISNKATTAPKLNKARTPTPIALQSTLVVQALDVLKNEVIWKSSAVTAISGSGAGATPGFPGGVPAAGSGGKANEASAAGKQVLDELGEFFEKSLAVADMPALTPESVQSRADALASQQYSNPLPVLMELRYYQVRKLLTAEQIKTYFTKILGDTEGPALAAGPEPARKEIVEKWIGQ
jgi:hypothetical protein